MRNPNFSIEAIAKKLIGTRYTVQQAVTMLYPGMDWISDVKGVEAEELYTHCFQCSECRLWYRWERICSGDDDCLICENCDI